MAPAALIRRTPIIVGLLAVASAPARNREEARLRELAVGHEINAAIDLLSNAVRDRLRQLRLVRLVVVRLLGEFRLHDVEQIVRPRQAADVRGLDAVVVLLDSHELSPKSFASL